VSGAEQQQLESFATVAHALRRVASLGRALRRGPVGSDYIGHAIEGEASVALQALLSWSLTLPRGATWPVEARIRASLGHGDRAVLGLGYARGMVEAARRDLAS